jgi:hypothetical protein
VKTHNVIAELVKQDSRIYECFEYYVNTNDPLHVERKQQQRGITTSMLLIALYYGKRNRTYQDLSYTVLDKSLKGTIYEKYIDKLRGLTIIGGWDKERTKFTVITAYWNFVVKSKNRY